MLAISPALKQNMLLASLSAADSKRLQPHLAPVPLALRHVLEQPNRRIEHAYFMEAGMASVVAVQARETKVEVGLIGREGMSGLPIVLGSHRSPHSTYIQAAGRGQRISADELRKALDASASLHASLLKFVQAFMTQTSHTAISNACAKLDERLARWILMAHDRISDDALPLTHEFLGLMLGCQTCRRHRSASRARKTRARSESSRGQIIVRDRKGIEKSAGDSYGVPEAEYRRLIG